MERGWTVHRRAPQGHFDAFAALPWPVAQVLWNRGVTSPEAARTFFARRMESDDPFLLRDMDRAVDRIRRAIAAGEHILVHGDYDVDGVTSTRVMVEGLQALGATVAPHIPDRVTDGYGLNQRAIPGFHARGVSLLVSVDCGIRDTAAIEAANEWGIDVIVTDHHTPPDPLPPAFAIINPKQPGCPYPYKKLAGVGLAWKTLQALAQAPLDRARAPLDLDSLLDLVALGTVADVAPLTGENRALVWAGLQQLRRTPRLGLQALMSVARVSPPEADTESIGFGMGPRINAAGRLQHAMLAYKLLSARSEEEARLGADTLDGLNQERQAHTARAMARAEAQIQDPSAPLLLVGDGQCPEGIVGLVAGKLTERYHRPAIVVSQGPGEVWRASCRSIPEFNIIEALDAVAPLLERHGGHAAAAGLSVRKENLPALEEALCSLAERALRGKPLRPLLHGDAELPLREVDDALFQAIERLAPFGEANRKPLWMCRNVTVDRAWAVGDGKHLKLKFLDERGRRWPAIAFGRGEQAATLPPRLDIAYSLQRNDWQQKEQLELHLSDFRPAAEGDSRR